MEVVEDTEGDKWQWEKNKNELFKKVLYNKNVLLEKSHAKIAKRYDL